MLLRQNRRASHRFEFPRSGRDLESAGSDLLRVARASDQALPALPPQLVRWRHMCRLGGTDGLAARARLAVRRRRAPRAGRCSTSWQLSLSSERTAEDDPRCSGLRSSTRCYATVKDNRDMLMAAARLLRRMAQASRSPRSPRQRQRQARCGHRAAARLLRRVAQRQRQRQARCGHR